MTVMVFSNVNVIIICVAGQNLHSTCSAACYVLEALIFNARLVGSAT